MATLNTTYQMVELIDPMICSRFYVKFLNKNLNIEPHTICKIDLPKFSNGEWQDLNIEFLNFVDCNTVEQLSKIVSSPNTTYCIQINLLDPVGNEVGK